MIIFSPDKPISVLRAGLLCRCPRCGKGSIYIGYLKVVEKCSNCQLEIRENDAGDGPAVFVVLAIGAIVVGLALWVEISYQPQYWVHLAIWAPLIIGSCIGALRPTKAFFIAIQLKQKVLDFDKKP